MIPWYSASSSFFGMPYAVKEVTLNSPHPKNRELCSLSWRPMGPYELFRILHERVVQYGLRDICFIPPFTIEVHSTCLVRLLQHYQSSLGSWKSMICLRYMFSTSSQCETIKYSRHLMCILSRSFSKLFFQETSIFFIGKMVLETKIWTLGALVATWGRVFASKPFSLCHST